MKAKICTDREQSKWLMKHGLEPKTADMGWFPEKDSPTALECELTDALLSVGNFTPAWSFPQLMSLMPRRIDNGKFSLVMNEQKNAEIRYGVGANMVSYEGKELVDAAVPMVAFLLLHHFIKRIN